MLLKHLLESLEKSLGTAAKLLAQIRNLHAFGCDCVGPQLLDGSVHGGVFGLVLAEIRRARELIHPGALPVHEVQRINNFFEVQVALAHVVTVIICLFAEIRIYRYELFKIQASDYYLPIF